MAIVSFDVKDLQRANASKHKLEDVVTSMGVEVEEVSGKEIKLNITPNRPDLQDIVGLYRAIVNFTGRKKPADKFYRITNQPAMTIAVTGQISKVRPYIAGMVVKNADMSGNRLRYLINFTEKFADTYGRKRRKLAIGLHNLGAIDGNLKYTAASSGSITPLGSSRQTNFDSIMKENAKGITYQDTVPNYGSKSVLYPVLKDESKTIALIPITNCEETKVTEKTKELFIDIAGTSNTAIINAAAVMACSFIDLGADVYPVKVNYGSKKETTPNLEYREIKVGMSKADSTIGIVTGRHNVIDFANRMGYTAAKYGGNVLFYVPPYRVDVLNEQDVIEDIAIAYGYDRIMPLAVSGVSSGMSDQNADYENKMAYMMVGLGYTEAINSMLTSEEVNFQSMRAKANTDEYVTIADSKTSSITMLRTSVLPSLMQDIAASVNATMPQRLFEIGNTFTMRNGVARNSIKLGFVSTHSKANFSEAKSTAEAVFKQMGKDFKIEGHEDAAFIPGRCAKVTVDGRVSAVFGEVHPEVLKSFKIEEPAVAAEIVLNDAGA